MISAFLSLYFPMPAHSNPLEVAVFTHVVFFSLLSAKKQRSFRLKCRQRFHSLIPSDQPAKFRLDLMLG